MEISPFSLQFIFPLFLFAVSATATPGPNNVMVTASGANYGYIRSLPHILGITFGFPIMMFSVGFGLGEVFISYPLFHDVIKYLGLCYLIFLSWKIASAVPFSDKAGDIDGRPLTLFQAALFQWLNPKAWTMVVSSLGIYTSPGPNYIFQLIVMSLIFLLITFPSASSWCLFGIGVSRFLRDRFFLRLFNIFMACLLLGSVVFIYI